VKSWKQHAGIEQQAGAASDRLCFAHFAQFPITIIYTTCTRFVDHPAVAARVLATSATRTCQNDLSYVWQAGGVCQAHVGTRQRLQNST
jgi:hypothetical protein